MAGRKQNNEMYFELQFTLVKINNKKYIALCGICGKTLANTACSRLKAHRNMCGPKLNTKMPQSESPKRKIKKYCESNILSDDENQNFSEGSLVLIYNLEENMTTTNNDLISTQNIGANVEMETANTSNGSDLVLSSLVPPSKSPNSFIPLRPLSAASTITSEYLSSDHSYSTDLRSCRSDSSSLSLASGKSLDDLLRPQICLETSDKNKLKKRDFKRKKSLTNFIDKVTPKKVDQLNESLAHFFFGCNIPLSVVDSDHFKTFMTDLRPAYGSKLPSRKVLSTTLLDNAYKKCIEKTTGSVNMHTVLLIDGWKNSSINSKTVVSMLHDTTGSKAFLNAWDLTGELDTGDKLTEIVNESIQLAKDLYSTNVYAVVSDNAAAMLKMGRTVEIWHSNCNLHTANLLAKDVLDDNCTKKVLTVLKEFKNSDFEKAVIDKQGTRMKLPADTRWCSYRDSYSCLIKNLQIMKMLIDTDPNFKKIKQNVKCLVFDDDFAKEVSEYIFLFDPICKLINQTQSMNCSVAEAVDLWLDLEFPESFSNLNPKLEHRRTMALNIYALSSFYVHPLYNKDSNVRLSVSQNEQVREFLLQHLDAAGIMDLHNFIENNGVFKILNDKNITDPIVFWNMAKVKHPNLSDLAIKLLQIPASSAQIERVFSNWSYVHSQIRNRLTFERSKKLLHVYYSLKIFDSNNSDEY